MAYTDSSGKVHFSLSEASRGRAAQTTASRNAAGEIVGSSSGSNYARAQEEQQEQARAAAEQNSIRNSIKYNPETPAWATAPGETANIDRSQLQKFKTVEQLEAEKNKGTISRTLSAFKQGYKAGEGKEYSLEGLKAPVNRAQDMATYSLYEKSTALTEKYNSLQNSALSRVPSGLGKDILTGLSNVPEMAIGAVGAVPLGLESMARNPSSVTDSISFGFGAMAGATVEKAQTHPGELAGELIGSWALAKGGSSLSRNIKPSLNSQGLKEFSLNERASLGSQKLVYRESALKSSELPKVESYTVVGDEILPESMTKINRVTLGDNVVLTPEMEEVLFGKSSISPQLESARLSSLNRDIFSPELTASSEYAIRSIQAPELMINSIEAVEVGGLISRSQGVVIPSLAYSLPFAGQGLSIQGRQVQQEQTKSSFMTAPLPAVSLSSSLAGSQLSQETTLQKEQNTNTLYSPQLPSFAPIESQKTDSIIIHDTFPNTPQYNILDNTGGSDSSGWDTPAPWGKLPGKKPIVLSDDSLNIFSESGKPKRRKTKQKQIKNTYGDPLNIKLKL